MTIYDALHNIDSVKPNVFDEEQKVAWLSQIDQTVFLKIFETHEGEHEPFEPYTVQSSYDTELRVPAPFDRIYEYWLGAQIDFANGEIAKYNNSIALYNTLYDEFWSFWNRTHMPKRQHRRFY